ncbi:hypothetical protein [Phytohabitans kaempferiae]|uniref:Transcriptional regulator n=1 Tax=Phytohabitans kaempferiae TaxID=1620943 RepID=A0ABV6MBI0_9ACTN
MPKRNEPLAELVTEAGFSEGGLARRVNELGLTEGLQLTYDYTAVYRWVRKGQCPEPPVPALIAQALSERLGRQVRPSDFGMTDTVSLAARALAYSSDVAGTIDTILELGRTELKSRGVQRRRVVAAPFVLAAAAGPSRDWLLSTLDETFDQDTPRKIGMRQVDGIRRMFKIMQEMDVMRGGGHARVALVEYLSGYVLPLVRHQHDQEAIQLALYEAAAEQAYLVGWMAYDDGQHGLAQRYLIQSLRLASASKNKVLGAHVLAGMSDQANLLGYPEEALALARVGQRGIALSDSPACVADLQILEARALAALARDGRPKGSVTEAVRRAEATFQHVRPDNEPEWARFIDPAYLFGEAAHCFRDIGDTAQIDRFAGESAAEAARQRRARRGALSQAALVVGDLLRDEVERAAARGQAVVSLAETVESSRCIETVRDLTKRFKPYEHVPDVQAFQRRASQLLAAA